MTRRSVSLKMRLAGTLGLFFLGGMVALYAAATSYAALAADRSYDRVLSGSALSIAETLSVSDRAVAVDIPYAALDMLSAAPDDRVFYRVIGPDGATVTGYGDLPDPPRARGTGGRDDSAEEQAEFFDATYLGERVRFAVLGREVSGRGAPGVVQVQVGQTRRARELLARDLVIGALAPILIMTVLALAVVWFGIGIALRPLSRVSDELMRRQPEDYGEIGGTVPVEIAPLVDALNGFMRRLNENIIVLRTFIADAAHQIRTPLASLSAQAQLAETEEADELKASLASIRRNASKLTRLVNQLLSDATIQHRSDVRRFESYDLLRIVRQAIRDSVPLSEDSDVRLTTILDTAPCIGDPVMIGEAVKNLIHNALTHGRSEDGEVSILLRATGDAFALSVSDRGAGIAQDARERVFDRFAKGDGGSSGAGLGLAIVRQAVRAHGGQVDLADRVGGGLTVTITLPGAQA